MNTNDKSGWISVGDLADKDNELPKEDGYTLVYVNGMIKVRWYSNYFKKWHKCFTYHVTHWQPLPQPPQTKNS